MGKIKKNWKRCCLTLILSMLCLVSATPVKGFDNFNRARESRTEKVLTVYDVDKISLIKEVDEYISNVAPKSKIKGKVLVNKCLEYDVDIKLALAQGHLESHFGTKGVASQTNSVFNVGAYDGRSSTDMIKKGLGYKDPNKSIEPYLQLLKSQYLAGGRTTKDLLHNFVNTSGHRYACKGYERNLAKIYHDIDITTKITAMFNRCRKYKT